MKSAEEHEATEQKWPNHLVIVRHGESERNVAKEHAKLSGHSSFGSGLRDVDTALSKEGQRQATATGQHLSQVYSFDAIFTSPYKRTRETSELIRAAFEHKSELVTEERIREIEFGILDGLTSDGIIEQYPKEYLRRKRERKYWY